jgi:hypothetical protein
MAWPMNTRQKVIALTSRTSTNLAGETLSWDVPKTGILAGLWMLVTGTLTGTPSTLNALGKANLITRYRMVANAGITLIDVSGPGYHYLMRDMIEHNVDPVPQADGRSAVASGAFDLSAFFPVALNARDPLGLIMLQNEDTQLRLELEIGAVTQLANDFSAISLTCQPFLELFTVPQNSENWPPFQFAHTWSEEQLTISGAGDVTFYWPRGNIYAQMIHGAGIGAAGADNFTQFKVRINQSDYLIDAPAAFLTRQVSRYRGRTRVAGVIPVDFLSMSGLGNYGSGRDLLDSRQLTDLASVITASAAGTLYTVKRQLVPLRQPG